MKRLRIGLVGAGGFAETNHYGTLKGFADVELVAICDVVESRSRQVAGRLGIGRTYTHHQELLEQENLDAAYVIMAPHRSYDVIADFLRAGVPTFIEKPGVLTTYQGESLFEIAEAAGTFCMVGFNRRFMPALVEAKRRVCASGPLRHCVATYYKNAPLRYYDGAIDFFRCDAIHAVDALRWMAGEVVDLVARAGRNGNRHRHAFSALLEFESGCTGVLMVNWAVAQRVHTFELHGRGASAFVDPTGECIIITDACEAPQRLRADAIAGTAESSVLNGFVEENRCFVESVKAGVRPESDLADALKTYRLVDQILQSAR